MIILGKNGMNSFALGEKKKELDTEENKRALFCF